MRLVNAFRSRQVPSDHKLNLNPEASAIPTAPPAPAVSQLISMFEKRKVKLVDPERTVSTDFDCVLGGWDTGRQVVAIYAADDCSDESEEFDSPIISARDLSVY